MLEEQAHAAKEALHWSLTQFTPAGLEIWPYNAWERVYAILVLLLVMVAFSSFVSSIPSGMTHYRKLKTDSAQAEAALRRFFLESHISAELGQRIWESLWNAYFRHRKTLHRAALQILSMVPEGLKNTLHEELYLPVMMTCPLFDVLEEVDEHCI